MSSDMPPDPDDHNGNRTFADTIAAAWFVILIAGIVSVAALVAWRVPIEGTITATAAMQNVVRPAVIALGVVVVVVSYIAARELFGRRTTDGAIGNLVGLARDAGAAEEMRRRERESDDE